MARRRNRRSGGSAGGLVPGITEQTVTRRVVLSIGVCDSKGWQWAFPISKEKMPQLFPSSALEWRLVSMSGRWYGTSGSNSQGTKSFALTRTVPKDVASLNLAYVLSLGGRAAPVGTNVNFGRIAGDATWHSTDHAVGSCLLAATVPAGAANVDLGYIELDVSVRLRGLHATALSAQAANSPALTWGQVDSRSLQHALSAEIEHLPVQKNYRPWAKSKVGIKSALAGENPLTIDVAKATKVVMDYLSRYNNALPKDNKAWDLASQLEIDGLMYAFFFEFFDGGICDGAKPDDHSSNYQLSERFVEAILHFPIAVEVNQEVNDKANSGVKPVLHLKPEAKVFERKANLPVEKMKWPSDYSE